MCSSDTLIPTTPPVDIMVITYTLLYALHLELLHTRFAFCYLAVVVVACRIRCTSTAGSIGRLFVRDKQETSCRKIMAEGDSAAPISPTTTDGVQGLHSSPRPLATTTTTLAPRLEILQNRPGSVEIAFFFIRLEELGAHHPFCSLVFGRVRWRGGLGKGSTSPGSGLSLGFLCVVA